MLSTEQMQKLWDLSDTVLYQEAVDFIRRLVKTEGHDPLPPSQVRGLLNITGSSNYSQIETFIIHQRERDWTYKQRNIKVFYTELEKIFTAIRAQRLRREFALVDESASPQVFRQQVDALMVFLIREYLQHLIAENNLFVQEKEEQQRKNKASYHNTTKAYPPAKNTKQFNQQKR